MARPFRQKLLHIGKVYSHGTLWHFHNYLTTLGVALIMFGDREGKVCHKQMNASWEIFVNNACFLTGKTVLKYHPQNRTKKFVRIYYAYLLNLKTNWTIKRIFFIMCVIKVKFPGNFLFVYLGCYKCEKYFFFR